MQALSWVRVGPCSGLDTVLTRVHPPPRTTGHEGPRASLGVARGKNMRRLLGASLGAAVALLLLGLFTGSARAASFNCSEPEAALCAETADSIGYGGEYTGHDEPSLLFYSNQPGSGESSNQAVRGAKEPEGR